MEIATIPYKSVVSNSSIMKPNYHLNYGKKRIGTALRNNKPFEALVDITSNVYTGGIFKRVFVEDEKFGIPYISAQHMMNADPLDIAKIISKKYTPRQNDMTLRNTQILVSCAGTVGNVRLIGEDLDGVIGSQDIIRVLADNENIPYGFIYAYLASPTAYNYIQSFIYGSVVPRISPDELGKLPVPILSNSKQQQIHNLIVEASKLRVEANKLLTEAHKKVEEKINFEPKQNRVSQKVSINTIFDTHQKRYEAQYYVSEGYEIKEHIKENEFKYLHEVCKPVFRPGIFKRHYVDSGLEFLGGSDIVRAIPKSDKKLSIAKTTHLNELKIEEDWILVTCGGTIGYSVIVNRYLADKTASQHILRVIADDIKSGYLFAFMSSSLGLKAIQSFTYGSVIPQIEPHHLELLPIPILNEELMDEIHNMVMKYKENISTAIENELEAINLIENEIEQWQES